ncbi:hypothetical protein EI94DRAFT_1816486 [Lactarius quietus]|nr:hypothetical protein EI94DRAFT_1816486 [Lactarius quietus]
MLSVSSADTDEHQLSEYSPRPTLNVSPAAPVVASTSLSQEYKSQDDDTMVDEEAEDIISGNAMEDNDDMAHPTMDNEDDIAACVAQDEYALEPPQRPRSPGTVADPSADPMAMDMDVGPLYEDEDPPQVTEPHVN